MANGRTPKDMLHDEFVTGTRTAGRPYLRYRDTCKRDMKVAGIDTTMGIDTTIWEAATDDRGHWRSVVKAGMRTEYGSRSRSAHEAEPIRKFRCMSHTDTVSNDELRSRIQPIKISCNDLVTIGKIIT